MNRREFIKQTASAAAASLAIGGGVLILGKRGLAAGKTIPEIYQPKNYRIQIDPDKPILAAAQGKDWRKATAAAIECLGGIGAFIVKGDYVCIKPNIGWDRTPELGADTHPDIIAELTSLCFKAGAAKVVIIDVPCNSPDRTYNRSGIKAAAEAEGATVVMADSNYLQEIDFGPESLGRWQVLKPVLECNKLINVPVIKHHSLSGITAAMKNWLGALSGPRNRLHQGIDDNMAELGRLFQPSLIIADATRVLQRNGPTGGRIEDVITYNTVVASIDQVAADSYVTRFLNKKPADFAYLKIAQDKGVGAMELPRAKLAEIEI